MIHIRNMLWTHCIAFWMKTNAVHCIANGESGKTRKTRKKCKRHGQNTDGIGKVRQHREIVTYGPYKRDLLCVDKKW